MFIQQDWLMRQIEMMVSTVLRLAGLELSQESAQGEELRQSGSDWLEQELTLGSQPPRDEAAVRRDIFHTLAEHPAFGELGEDPRFQELLHSLEREGRKYL